MSAIGRYFLTLILVILFIGNSSLCAQNTNASTNLAGQVGAGSPCPGAVQHMIYQFHLRAFSFGAQTFTAINNFTTSGTYAASDIVRYQLWSTNFSFFGGGSLVLHATLPASGPGTKTFSGFSRALPGGGSTAVFFWITADFAAGAVPGRTLRCDLMNASMFAVTGGGVTTGPTWNAAGIQTICTPMPIDLIYFKGKPNGTGNLLEWATETETNNNHFTLERSYNGADFVEFNQIPGAGNSREPLQYSLNDPEPFSGITYYRLKQTDHNGEYTYEGGIIAIENSGKDEPYLYFDLLTNVFLVGNISEPIHYTLQDLTGKILTEGTLTEDLNRPETEGKPQGIYLLTLKTADRVFVKKMAIQPTFPSY